MGSGQVVSLRSLKPASAGSNPACPTILLSKNYKKEKYIMFSKEFILTKLKNRLYLLENRDCVRNARIIAKLKRRIALMEA